MSTVHVYNTKVYLSIWCLETKWSNCDFLWLEQTTLCSKFPVALF